MTSDRVAAELERLGLTDADLTDDARQRMADRLEATPGSMNDVLRSALGQSRRTTSGTILMFGRDRNQPTPPDAA